jgi:hypothetical protein
MAPNTPASQTRFSMSRPLALAILASAFITGGVHAQSRPAPDDAAAPVAPKAYESAFKGYQPYRDEPLAPWREVNDTARQVGGHVGVLRAEQQGAARPAAETTPIAPPAHEMPQSMRDGNPKK